MLTIRNLEDHMQEQRHPKDRPPPQHVIDSNRAEWYAIYEGVPNAAASFECPLLSGLQAIVNGLGALDDLAKAGTLFAHTQRRHAAGGTT